MVVVVVGRMFGSLIIGVVVVVDKQVVVVKMEIVIGKLMAVVVVIVDTNYSVQQEFDYCCCY